MNWNYEIAKKEKVSFFSSLAEENQKKYAEDDARIRESPIVKKLLEQSKLNKEK